MEPLSVYIHWPFCKSKCPYCDFNSHVRELIDHKTWLEYYQKEIAFYFSKLGRRTIETIFFGGGTPSLMEPQTVRGILGALADHTVIAKDAEITLEANPTSVEAEKFAAFREAGVNRVSLGIQSLTPENLKFLGREHSASEARAAVGIAQKYFDNVSVDFICALPNQTVDQWEKELKEAIDFGTQHLSLYQLTIEKGTKFFALHQAGAFTMPNDDVAHALYDMTENLTRRAGFAAYEVSNYAKENAASRHNYNYWRYGEYVGVGPGAHGRIAAENKRVATVNLHAPEAWLTAMEKSPSAIQQWEEIPQEIIAEEMIMMGLRTQEGVHLDRLQKLCGKSLMEVVKTKKLEKLLREKYLVKDGNFLRATYEGRLVLNALVRQLLG